MKYILSRVLLLMSGFLRPVGEVVVVSCTLLESCISPQNFRLSYNLTQQHSTPQTLNTYILARLLDFGSAHVAATKRELTLSTVKSLKSLFVVVKITFEHQSHRELFHTDMCDFMCDFMLDISEFVNRRSYGDHTSLFRGFLHHIVYRFPAYLCYYFSFRVA